MIDKHEDEWKLYDPFYDTDSEVNMIVVLMPGIMRGGGGGKHN